MQKKRLDLEPDCTATFASPDAPPQAAKRWLIVEIVSCSRLSGAIE